VNVACPELFVTPDPLLRTLGPLSMLKFTVLPDSGAPLLVTVAVSVWLPPTGSV
jgi:hypothetical protein